MSDVPAAPGDPGVPAGAGAPGVPGVPAHRPAGLPQPDRALVLGVLNVTPDSFSDGGRWFDPDRAIGHGLAMLAEGADLIDVGGESTRPGAVRPTEAEETRRVVPIVRALTEAGAKVSIDTMRASVAERAVAAGAVMVNDVSGGLADSGMFPTVADLEVPLVLMHWRGHSDVMDRLAVYDDVVREVVDELRTRVDSAVAAGIDPDRIGIDPGLGFAKNADHNWALLRHLDRLVGIGLPVLVGASRKRFLGALLGDPARGGAPRPPGERDDAGVAVATLAATAGAWAIRTHVVRPTVDAVTVAARWWR
ncbi:MAG TPA: dihydropteroate synthase [Actinopolymorphaceae bacterium]